MRDVVEENAKMTDCYFEKKDWRACASEVCRIQSCKDDHGLLLELYYPGDPFLICIRHMAHNQQMEAFKQCWKRHNNDQRTESKDI